jgi:hypothetical protein
MLEGVGEDCIGDGVLYAYGPNAMVLVDRLGEDCFILCDMVGWGCVSEDCGLGLADRLVVFI